MIIKLAFLSFNSEEHKQAQVAGGYLTAHHNCFYNTEGYRPKREKDEALMTKRNNLSKKWIKEFDKNRKSLKGVEGGHNFFAKQMNDAIKNKDKEFEDWNKHNAKYWDI